MGLWGGWLGWGCETDILVRSSVFQFLSFVLCFCLFRTLSKSEGNNNTKH